MSFQVTSQSIEGQFTMQTHCGPTSYGYNNKQQQWTVSPSYLNS